MEPNLVGMFSGSTKFMFFFVDQKYTKDTRGPNVSESVCPNTWVYINYCSFAFDEDFFNAFPFQKHA